jgi:hypothetical protein
MNIILRHLECLSSEAILSLVAALDKNPLALDA